MKGNYYIKKEIACSSSTEGDEFYAVFMSNTVKDQYKEKMELWLTQNKKNNLQVEIETAEGQKTIHLGNGVVERLTFNHSFRVSCIKKKLCL